jgi:hypothetical protein
MSTQPDIQLFCNLVIRRPDGAILFVKQRDDERWWLPWADIEPYQHPDEAVAVALEKMRSLKVVSKKLAQIQSFRGRAGWHVTFDYHIEASGEVKGEMSPTWFAQDNLPRTVHGEWEKQTVRDVLHGTHDVKLHSEN